MVRPKLGLLKGEVRLRHSYFSDGDPLYWIGLGQFTITTAFVPCYCIRYAVSGRSQTLGFMCVLGSETEAL